MKANSIGVGPEVGLKLLSGQVNFRSEKLVHAPQNGRDEFVRSKKSSSQKTIGWVVAGLIVAGAGALLAHQSGWWGKCKEKLGASAKETLSNKEFKSVEEAKKYFENLGIETDFRGASEEHLPMLKRIQENLKQLKELGVKKEKPDSITISDWENRTELEELYRVKGVFSNEYKPEYFAQSIESKNGKNHIFINSNKPNFDMFRHEMGHVNDFSCDSYWHSKGIKGHDFTDNQLKILGRNEKIYRSSGKFNNIFYFHPKETNTSFTFPDINMETRYVHAQDMISKMQSETGCYAPTLLHEQKAYIFENLLQGKKFSDEVMIYYDFAGGARIPNLKIDGKTYDEYIESLYNNKDLIAKLRENIKISKI